MLPQPLKDLSVALITPFQAPPVSLFKVVPTGKCIFLAHTTDYFMGAHLFLLSLSYGVMRRSMCASVVGQSEELVIFFLILAFLVQIPTVFFFF